MANSKQKRKRSKNNKPITTNNKSKESKTPTKPIAKKPELSGTVKWFDIFRGIGFVTDDDGNDHFIHHSGIAHGRRYTGFKKGDRVDFNLEVTKEGYNPQVVGAVLIREKTE